MAHQNIFKRYEIKYLLTLQQKAQILDAMAPYMLPDAYGRTTIRNIYFDTENYRLIRRSLERPVYKEKLRLRSYCQAQKDSQVFAELKKKYKGVVYKRRVALPQDQAMAWLCGDAACPLQGQIPEEIDYFKSYYGSLRPTVFLSYQRQAYLCKDGTDFRVTFDEEILCRREALSLTEAVYGEALLPPGKVLMEIKTPGGIPLWMTRALTREGVFKTSFSKYGRAYQTMIFTGGLEYA